MLNLTCIVKLLIIKVYIELSIYLVPAKPAKTLYNLIKPYLIEHFYYKLPSNKPFIVYIFYKLKT